MKVRLIYFARPSGSVKLTLQTGRPLAVLDIANNARKLCMHYVLIMHCRSSKIPLKEKGLLFINLPAYKQGLALAPAQSCYAAEKPLSFSLDKPILDKQSICNDCTFLKANLSLHSPIQANLMGHILILDADLSFQS